MLVLEFEHGRTRDPHELVPGQVGEYGFVFAGYGDKDWCEVFDSLLQSLNNADLPCRSQEGENFCRFGFVGDKIGAKRVRAKCSKAFDVIHVQDLKACGIESKTSDKRAWKVCARVEDALFTYNVLIDGDAIVTSSEVEQLFTVLRPPNSFELAGVFECCARNYPGKFIEGLAEHHLLHGWEVNTGVLAWRNCEAVHAHARKTIEILQVEKITSAEQPYFTLALSRSDVRFLPLPPNFNFRKHTAAGYGDLPYAIVHARNLKNLGGALNLIKKVRGTS